MCSVGVLRLVVSGLDFQSLVLLNACPDQRATSRNSMPYTFKVATVLVPDGIGASVRREWISSTASVSSICTGERSAVSSASVNSVDTPLV